MLTRFNIKLGDTASNMENKIHVWRWNHKYNQQYKIRLSEQQILYRIFSIPFVSEISNSIKGKKSNVLKDRFHITSS